MLMQLEHVSRNFGEKTILNDISLTIHAHEKVALIGRNGIGKSTLLSILAGSGSFEGRRTTARNLQIRQLTQIPSFEKEKVLEEMRYQNGKLPLPCEEYELRAILDILLPGREEMKISHLSGGQRKRLALAITLLHPGDLLLLDEPTNHLDVGMIEWLEKRLKKSRCALVLISHDRYFIESLCTKIIELDQGRLFVHEGGYAAYLEEKAIRYEKMESDRLKENALYRKELSWVKAGVQARSTKQKSRLDRFEKLRLQRHTLLEQKLEIADTAARLGKKTISWTDLAFGYADGPLLFSGFSCTLKRDARIGILGGNGTGKTTFLNLLAGLLQPSKGNIEIGETVRIGYFRQQDPRMSEDQRVIDYLEEDGSQFSWNGKTLGAENLLKQFHFDDSIQYLPLHRLSGGEKRRLQLLKVLLTSPNVLLLDEPGNDLDLDTLTVLEEYLDEFPGIVITVCHDRYFLDRVCDQLFVLEADRTFHPVQGGYTDYQFSRTLPVKQETEKKVKTVRPARSGLSFPQKRKMGQLEQEMQQLEEKIARENETMNTISVYEEILACVSRREALQNRLEEAEMEWMELAEIEEAA